MAACTCCEATEGVERDGVIGVDIDPISGLCLHCQPCSNCGRMGTGCLDPFGPCDPLPAAPDGAR